MFIEVFNKAYLYLAVPCSTCALLYNASEIFLWLCFVNLPYNNSVVCLCPIRYAIAAVPHLSVAGDSLQSYIYAGISPLYHIIPSACFY